MDAQGLLRKKMPGELLHDENWSPRGSAPQGFGLDFLGYLTALGKMSSSGH